MLNEMVIKALEEKGFKRWTNYGKDRLYVDAKALGFDKETYKYRGERVSNSVAGIMMGAKTYIDVETGTVSSGSWILKCDVEVLLENLIDFIEGIDAESAEQASDELPRSGATVEDEEIENEYIEDIDAGTAEIMAKIPPVEDDGLKAQIERKANEIRTNGLSIMFGPNPYLCNYSALCQAQRDISRELELAYRDMKRTGSEDRFITLSARLAVLAEIRADRF